MSPLLALVLAAAPGCPAALASAAATPAEALGTRAPALVEALEDAGAGGPTIALAAAARAVASAGPDPAVRDRAAAAFRGALVRQCALAAEPVAPEASAADRAALDEILARPELARSRSDPYALRRALLRFWDWLTALLGTEEAERYASLGRALFLGVAAGAAVLAWDALRKRVRERQVAAAVSRGGGTGTASPADESAARADDALRRGDGHGAVRFALLAALAALERAGRVPRGRALTNGEVVAALATSTATVTVRPERSSEASASERSRRASTPTPTSTSTSTLTSDLAALTRAFDRAIYGGLPVGLDDARAAVERSHRIALAAGGRR